MYVTSICADNAFIVVYAVTLTDPESARHLTPSSSPPHQHTMEDMKITQNHAYAKSTNTTDVEYYATIADNQVLVSPSKREVTTHLPAALDEEIATVTNECYSTSRLPSPTRPCVHQQQDMQLTQNQAYVASVNFLINPMSLMAPQLPPRSLTCSMPQWRGNTTSHTPEFGI